MILETMLNFFNAAETGALLQPLLCKRRNNVKITREERNGCAFVKIEGAFSIYEAASLRKTFLECFDAYEGLILDLNDVTECDTAGIQLLCAARVTAETEGKTFSIEGMSETVVNALISGGLAPEKIVYKKGEV